MLSWEYNKGDEEKKKKGTDRQNEDKKNEGKEGQRIVIKIEGKAIKR